MRLAVTEQGHGGAVLALVNANLLAARTSMGLSNRLQGYAGMAGDDSTATDFATSYDEAAAASVAALQPLVGAFATLAHLIEASLVNHGRAEARSTLPGWARPLTGPPTAADRSIGVTLPVPPSSLGADSPGPGGLAGVALDVLQDVLWPNADTDRLRSAASAWSTAAETLDLLTARCDSAVAALDDERSPELPLAVAVIGDLRRRVDDLSAQLASLSTACSDYADHVDAKRHELLDLLEDLAVDLGVGAVIAGGLSILSGGAAAGFAGGAGAARIASASTRFRSILDSLRILAAGPALEVRPVAVTAGEVGTFTGRISRARVMLMEAGEGVPSVTDGTPGLFTRVRSGWLDLHEGVGHTKLKHVGQTLGQMQERLRIEPKRTVISTFRDQSQAERAIERVLRSNEDKIEAWLKSGRGKRDFSADLGYDVGDILVRGADDVATATKARIVLIPDKSMPEGWRLLPPTRVHEEVK